MSNPIYNMKFSLIVSLVLWISITINTSFAYPTSGDNNSTNSPAAEDLKFKFETIDDIPAAFLDETATTNKPDETKKPKALSSQTNHRHQPVRPTYPACQDGSGGLCIPSGTCAADKKPEVVNANACSSGKECCFDVPANSTGCRERGGECVQAAKCGKGPQLKSTTECDHKNGETCCIWVF